MVEYDAVKVRDQLGRPEDKGINVKRFTEDIIHEEGPTQVLTRDITNSFILGDSTNGKLGDPQIGSGGKQVVLGFDDRDLVVSKVTNNSNIFRERFKTIYFKDSSNTTADWNVSSSGKLEMTSGEVAQSLESFKNDTNIISGVLSIEFETGDSSDVTVQLSSNGGNDFENATLNTEHTFAIVGQDLRWKITASDTIIITLVKLIYSVSSVSPIYDRIIESGDTRITEADDTRITE